MSGAAGRLDRLGVDVVEPHAARSVAVRYTGGAPISVNSSSSAGAVDAALPTVDVVAVNYNGRRHLEPFLESLRALDYPPARRRVVLVDNASIDGSPSFVRERFPEVRVVDAGGNLGFAGGCNLGMRQSRSDYVALVNNDTVVERDWLRALVEIAQSDTRIGMAGGKMLFLTPFIEIGLEVVSHDARASARSAALVLRSARTAGCEYDKLLVQAGRLGSIDTPDGPAHLLAQTSRLAVPVTRTDASASLLLELQPAPGRSSPVEVDVRAGGSVVARLRVEAAGTSSQCDLPADVVRAAAGDVINNAGTRVDGEGQFGDRGIFEFDRGQFDAIEDVPALCGASMLLRRRMLDEIGGFDTRYFMYFEDVDLSWRARRAGWRVVYTPHARLRHVHAASSREGSPLWRFFVARNRLFFLTKHGRAGAAAREVGRFYARAAIGAAAAVRRREPIPVSARIDMQVARSLARYLPSLAFSRYRSSRGDGGGRWTAVADGVASSR